MNTDAPRPSALTPMLREQLIEVLLRIPTNQTVEGRTSLLAGIPQKDGLQRNVHNVRSDLEQIITQLDGIGALTTGHWPLLLLIGNALPLVAGFAIEAKLKDVQRELVQGYSEAAGLQNDRLH